MEITCLFKALKSFFLFNDRLKVFILCFVSLFSIQSFSDVSSLIESQRKFYNTCLEGVNKADASRRRCYKDYKELALEYKNLFESYKSLKHKCQKDIRSVGEKCKEITNEGFNNIIKDVCNRLKELMNNTYKTYESTSKKYPKVIKAERELTALRDALHPDKKRKKGEENKPLRYAFMDKEKKEKRAEKKLNKAREKYPEIAKEWNFYLGVFTSYNFICNL